MEDNCGAVVTFSNFFLFDLRKVYKLVKTVVCAEVKQMVMKALTQTTDDASSSGKSFCATLPSPPDPGKSFCATLPSDP